MELEKSERLDEQLAYGLWYGIRRAAKLGRELILYRGGGCACDVPEGGSRGSNGAPAVVFGLAAIAITRRRRAPHAR